MRNFNFGFKKNHQLAQHKTFEYAVNSIIKMLEEETRSLQDDVDLTLKQAVTVLEQNSKLDEKRLLKGDKVWAWFDSVVLAAMSLLPGGTLVSKTLYKAFVMNDSNAQFDAWRAGVGADGERNSVMCAINYLSTGDQDATGEGSITFLDGYYNGVAAPCKIEDVGGEKYVINNARCPGKTRWKDGQPTELQIMQFECDAFEPAKKVYDYLLSTKSRSEWEGKLKELEKCNIVRVINVTTEAKLVMKTKSLLRMRELIARSEEGSYKLEALRIMVHRIIGEATDAIFNVQNTQNIIGQNGYLSNDAIYGKLPALKAIKGRLQSNPLSAQDNLLQRIKGRALTDTDKKYMNILCMLKAFAYEEGQWKSALAVLNTGPNVLGDLRLSLPKMKLSTVEWQNPLMKWFRNIVYGRKGILRRVAVSIVPKALYFIYNPTITWQGKDKACSLMANYMFDFVVSCWVNGTSNIEVPTQENIRRLLVGIIDGIQTYSYISDSVTSNNCLAKSNIRMDVSEILGRPMVMALLSAYHQQRTAVDPTLDELMNQALDEKDNLLALQPRSHSYFSLKMEQEFKRYVEGMLNTVVAEAQKQSKAQQPTNPDQVLEDGRQSLNHHIISGSNKTPEAFGIVMDAMDIRLGLKNQPKSAKPEQDLMLRQLQLHESYVNHTQVNSRDSLNEVLLLLVKCIESLSKTSIPKEKYAEMKQTMKRWFNNENIVQ